MSSLIPFQNRSLTPADLHVSPGYTGAQIVDVSSHAGRSRAVAAGARRRPRRDWDPAFHVDLLTF